MGEQRSPLIGERNSDEINRTVVCFDRDWTVSTNPARGREAVPLAWVKQLAHGTPEVDVWATGNQLLTAEASIHGTSYAAALWQTLMDRDVTDFYSGGKDHYYKPERADRLLMIEDLYRTVLPSECSLTFIVVDDVDLSHLEGWSYYQPWDFVQAVYEGVFDFFDSDDGGEYHSVSDAMEYVDTEREPSVSLGRPSMGNEKQFDPQDAIRTFANRQFARLNETKTSF